MTFIMITYIHYGSEHYNPNRFIPVRNDARITKPADGTGLWAGREGETYEDGRIIYGWKEWCRDSKYREELLKKSFRFRLADMANILTLMDPGDLVPLRKTAPWEYKDSRTLLNLQEGEMPTMEQLHEFYRRNPCFLDYEKLLNDGVDGIELRNSHLFARYLIDWNCDCLLVLNPEVIIPVSDTQNHVLIHPVKYPEQERGES